MTLPSTNIPHLIVDTLTRQRNAAQKSDSLYSATQISFAYNSEKIEGSLVTLAQTSCAFENGYGSDSSTGNPCFSETKNHFKLFDYMLDTLSEPLDKALIQAFHHVLFDTRPATSNWKTLPNGVAGIQTTPPHAVDYEITRLLKAYHSKDNKTYRDIVGFHVFFERIHPFQDGNGRVGRMVMFRECLANKLVPFVVLDETKTRYYQGLQEFDAQPHFLLGYVEELVGTYLEEYNHFLRDEALRKSAPLAQRNSDAQHDSQRF